MNSDSHSTGWSRTTSKTVTSPDGAAITTSTTIGESHTEGEGISEAQGCCHGPLAADEFCDVCKPRPRERAR
jgi:hypothetical protein